MNSHFSGTTIRQRPNAKTSKCAEITKRLGSGPLGPIAVSTLREAEYFADNGFRDILYGVGITPDKLDRVAALRAKGVDLIIVLDSVAMASVVAIKARETADPLPVMIEIDCDGDRAGVDPMNEAMIIEIGNALASGGAELRGVMSHSGLSYGVRSDDELASVAEQERRAAVIAASALIAAGLPCPVVSVGSTPTALGARDLSGVTEVRAGVFVFFDLVMAGIGVCDTDDIALSVLATVIGRRRDKEWLLVDAGWMAMSRDRGTASQPIDQGYGLVCAPDGSPYCDLIMIKANQEHGVVAVRHGRSALLPDLPIGSQVRILPNHACATAAQYDRYNVVRSDSPKVRAVWERCNGW